MTSPTGPRGEVADRRNGARGVVGRLLRKSKRRKMMARRMIIMRTDTLFFLEKDGVVVRISYDYSYGGFYS